MKIFEKSKGITLIALVITIVVLIILATVLINLTLGNNGIFTRAKLAKKQYEYGSAKQLLELKLLEIKTVCETDGIEYTIEHIADELGKSEEETIDIIYYYETIAKVNEQANERPVSVQGIVVIINDHPMFEFLIGEKSDESIGIAGVKETEPGAQNVIDFKDPEVFVEEVLGGGEVSTPTPTATPTPTPTPKPATTSDYIQNGLMLHLDGIKNTRSGHNSSATTWQDVSGNGIDFNVNGDCTWTNDGLEMHGKATENVTATNQNIVDILNDGEEDGFTLSTLVSGGTGLFMCGNSNNTDKKLVVRSFDKKIIFAFYGDDLECSYEREDKLAAIDLVYKDFYEGNTRYRKKYIYINGELLGSKNSGRLSITDGAQFIIGNATTSSSYYLNGKMSEVKLYNRALTDEEIASNYNVDILRYELK